MNHLRLLSRLNLQKQMRFVGNADIRVMPRIASVTSVRAWRSDAMKRAVGIFLSLVVFSSVAAMASPPPGKGALATVTGSVRDNKGNPVAGALISFVREGARKVVRETRSTANGSFTALLSPGRYGIE